ncbi:MAG: hypothetical protein ACRCTQ_01795 [Brevinemataceae bacterium]
MFQPPLMSVLTPLTPIKIQPSVTNDLVQYFPEYDSYINWSKKELVVEGGVPVSYNDPNIGRSIANLNEKLEDYLLEFLFKSVNKISVSSFCAIENAVQENQRLMFQIMSNASLLNLQNAVVNNSKMTGQIVFPLYGSNSIADLFYQNLSFEENTNYLQKETVASYVYDTLIIDMVMFDQFTPSLMPMIFDQKGSKIFSAANVDMSVLKTDGPVQYVKTLDEAWKHPKRGKKIAYVVPARIVGTTPTDIVLYNSDVRRIFSQRKTLNSLKKGNVIIVYSYPKTNQQKASF